MHDVKRLRRLESNKRGVSSIFIAIYLSLIGILLISTLFAGQLIAQSSITDYLKIEQDRRQEYFQITDLISDSSDINFTQLQVKNTGAITIRLRALYIAGEFKFDPSLNPGDAYIEPKETLNITFDQPIPIKNTTNVQWTVTSERGTRHSELGRNLWGEIVGPFYSPSKFYFGPLMLYFDKFYWESEDGGTNSGWSIPEKTKDVTWRVFLTNVDNRTIIITEDSDFSLVGNTGQQNWVLNWYVNPEQTTMKFEPGGLYSVDYTWSSPYSSSDNRITDISFNSETPCLNFLTFAGEFIELDNSTSPFGQTIPFEAVLITD